MRGTAALSTDGVYRYRLTRAWGPGAFATFVMLNPSTADADRDDATVGKCRRYAQSWGCGGLVVVNLYALRSREPALLRQHADPVGPNNDAHLQWAAAAAHDGGGPLVAAWGALAGAERVAQVLGLPGMSRLQALEVAKTGAPKHPLYLRGDVELQPWPGSAL